MYFDDILIYIENKRKKYVEAVKWVLNQLQKHLLYINLKKCQFYQDEVRFFNYIIFYQGIQIEEEQIKTIHN